MFRLKPALQDYAWGDETSIPQLLGQPPSGEPVAEAWWGAHPAAPTLCDVDGRQISLAEVIAQDPDAMLGAEVAERFDGKLPYLLKVLAIAKPLSIQVHPSTSQALAGFAAEDEAGIQIDAPNRVYRDRSHKPEMVVAITPMSVSTGFRPHSDVADDLTLIGGAQARELRDVLLGAATPTLAIAGYLRAALALPRGAGVLNSLRALQIVAEPSAAVRAAAASALAHPDDVGAAVTLAMNVENLQIGDACFTPAGTVHSYQRGVGLEVMANSDNVVRAGLTGKHVDVEQLLGIAVTNPTTPDRPSQTVEGAAVRYETPASEFELIMVRGGESGVAAGPRVALCLEGETVIHAEAAESATLNRGEAVFSPASDGELRVSTDGATAIVTVPGQPV